MGSPRAMEISPLHGRGAVKEIEGAPRTRPPSNEGGLQGGRWKSAPSLDSTVATPLKSPLGKRGDDLRHARTHEFFHTFRGAGVGCRESAGPTPKATPSAPPQRGFSRDRPLAEVFNPRSSFFHRRLPPWCLDRLVVIIARDSLFLIHWLVPIV